MLTNASSGLAAWPQLQDELAALSTASQHVYAQHSGHNIHLGEPAAVTRALRDMITRCQTAPTP